MPNNDGGSRSFLADEVQAQRVDLTRLVGAVSGLENAVKTLVEDAREERKDAREERRFIKEHNDTIRDQIYAQRDEQSQFSMSLTDIQSRMATIAKTLGEHETERQQAKGAFAGVRAVWVLVCALAASAAGFIGWLALKFGPAQPGGHP